MKSPFKISVHIAFIGLLFAALLHSNGQANEQRLKSFGWPDRSGFSPESPLIVGVDGALYGTTDQGGTNHGGTVFRMNTNGTGYTVLHHFNSSGIGGFSLFSGLLQVSDGTLYGTTRWGGQTTRARCSS